MLEITTYTGGIAATNGFLMRSEQACFVIDAPDGMAAWLEASPCRPAALLLTHAHFDHVLDAAAIQKLYGCPIFAFSEPTPELTLEAMVASFGPSMAIHPFTIEKKVVEGEALEVAGQRFEVLHIPGHSPDSVAFLPDNSEVIFSGDVLMQGGIGRDDLPGGDGDLLRAGIREKLYALPDAVMVYPGHGPATTIGVERRSNPFVRA